MFSKFCFTIDMDEQKKVTQNMQKLSKIFRCI